MDLRKSNLGPVRWLPYCGNRQKSVGHTGKEPSTHPLLPKPWTFISMSISSSFPLVVNQVLSFLNLFVSRTHLILWLPFINYTSVSRKPTVHQNPLCGARKCCGTWLRHYHTKLSYRNCQTPGPSFLNRSVRRVKRSTCENAPQTQTYTGKGMVRHSPGCLRVMWAGCLPGIGKGNLIPLKIMCVSSSCL